MFTAFIFPFQFSLMKYFLFLFSIILISACSFNQAVQHNGADFLQGTWNEDTVENKTQLANYEQHNFKFNCDSFYLQINSFSKVNLDGGECYNANGWKEYVKGYYHIKGDTLKFDGNFVNQEYKYKAEGSCYRSGKFFDEFIIQQQGDSIVNLKSTTTGLRHQLKLKEKSVCKQ